MKNPSKGKYYIVEEVGSGLRKSYPLHEVKPGTRVKLLEYAPKGSVDVVDVQLPNKSIASVYSFQLMKNDPWTRNPRRKYHRNPTSKFNFKKLIPIGIIGILAYLIIKNNK